MDIQQLSTSIDQKLVQLDRQLATIKTRLAQTTDDNEQLSQDLVVLEQVKIKLLKSRDIMWQAHELKRGTDQKRLNEKRLLGIALCVISGGGLIALIILLLSK